MVKYIKICLLLTIMLLPFKAYLAQFSADIEVEMEGHINQRGKIYVDDSLRRIEMNNLGDSYSIIILDLKKNKGYILLDKEQSFTELNDISSFTQEGNLLESKNSVSLGTEMLEGLSCRIIQKDLGNGIKQNLWHAKEIDFPVKIETTINGKVYSVMKYKNIKKNTINKELFNIPKNYRKLNSP